MSSANPKTLLRPKVRGMCLSPFWYIGRAIIVACPAGLEILTLIARQKPGSVGRGELMREQRAHTLGAKAAEIDVEVGMHRDQLADVDAQSAFAQAFCPLRPAALFSRVT